MTSAQIAAVAARAGVRRWWGSGPRPLNMPGAVPNAQWTGPREGGSVGTQEPRGPVVLEPTPAQLARGERVLWIEQTDQATAQRMLTWAREHGWEARLSRSRYLSEPTNAGAGERRGRRLEVETVALRMALVRGGYGISVVLLWEFDVERARWKPGTSSMVQVTPTGITGLRTVGVTEAQVMLGMVTEEEIAERREKARQTREAKKK